MAHGYLLVQGRLGSVSCWAAVCPDTGLLLWESMSWGNTDSLHRGHSRLSHDTDKGSRREKKTCLFRNGKQLREARA